jgi:hypothetical protein
MISIKTTDGKVIKSVTKEEAESIKLLGNY